MNYSVQEILHARKLESKPFPSPGDLPDKGIKPVSPALQADSLPTEYPILFIFSLFILYWGMTD